MSGQHKDIFINRYREWAIDSRHFHSILDKYEIPRSDLIHPPKGDGSYDFVILNVDAEIADALLADINNMNGYTAKALTRT